jgi:hypothetical protein
MVWIASGREPETIYGPFFETVIFLVTIVPPAEKVLHSSETGNQSGGCPTLSFWNLDFPSKVGVPSFAFSSEGWVYLQLRPLPKIFSANFPVKSRVKSLNAQKSP